MRTSPSIRVNFVIPKSLYTTLKALVPERKRSQVVTKLLQTELAKLENHLLKAAQSLEKDKSIHKEMKEWNVALSDGLEDEEWK